MDIFHIILLACVPLAWILGGRQEARHQTYDHLREDYIEEKAKVIGELGSLPEKREALAEAYREFLRKAKLEAERLAAKVGLQLPQDPSVPTSGPN